MGLQGEKNYFSVNSISYLLDKTELKILYLVIVSKVTRFDLALFSVPSISNASIAASLQIDLM